MYYCIVSGRFNGVPQRCTNGRLTALKFQDGDILRESLRNLLAALITLCAFSRLFLVIQRFKNRTNGF